MIGQPSVMAATRSICFGSKVQLRRQSSQFHHEKTADRFANDMYFASKMQPFEAQLCHEIEWVSPA